MEETRHRLRSLKYLVSLQAFFLIFFIWVLFMQFQMKMIFTLFWAVY